MKRRAGDRRIHTIIHINTARIEVLFMWGSLRLAPTRSKLISLSDSSKHRAYFTHINLAYNIIASSVDMRILYVSSDAPAIAENVYTQSMNRKRSSK